MREFPSACWEGICQCPEKCDCVGLGCDHAGTKMSWAHPVAFTIRRSRKVT